MTKGLLGRTALLLALAASVATPTLRALAKDSMDAMQMAIQAKTPADHEKLAAFYDSEAAGARAKAAMHKQMAEDIRAGKYGSALLAKLHYDQHCDGLVTSFTKAAEEYAALAEAEREMAKNTK